MSRLRLSLRPLWLVVPLALVTVFLIASSRAHQAVETPARPRPPGARLASSDGRLVIVILDSLRRATLEQPELMPNLLRLARDPGATTLEVHTCASNFSLPCIQTIFSGRESPMASGIEEFSGYGASHRHLIDAATDAGLNVALVGNDMVPTLYGRHARARFSVTPLKLEALPADLVAIAQAGIYLHDPSIDLVVLHTEGTDHVTHYQLPGSARYAEHFHAVDAALQTLVRDLDLTRDSLVVMGDHGHDNDGHHVTRSVAIFAGRRYRDLFEQIDVPARAVQQKDLLYLLSYPHGLAMSADYEGTFFALRPGRTAGPRLTAFLDVQRRVLKAEWYRVHSSERDSTDTGHQTAPAEAAVATRMLSTWRAGNEQARATLVAALPLLSCLFLWVALTYGATTDTRLSARPALVAGGAAVATWMAQGAGLLPPVALAALPLAGVAWLARSPRSSRQVLVLGLLLAGATITAAVEPAWRSFFHSRDEFHWGIPVFYALMLGAGGLLARVRGGGLTSWPWATQLAAFVALPAGVYYYQFDENPLRAYLIPAALLVTWRIIAGGRQLIRTARLGRSTTGGSAVARKLLAAWRWRWRAAVPLAIAGFLLMPQDAGGWQWHSWLAGRLGTLPRIVSVSIYLGGVIWLVAWLDSWRRRVPMAVLLLALPLYVTRAAGLPPTRLTAAFLVVLFAAAWLAARTPGPEAASKGVLADEMTGLMLAAAAVMIALTTCDGLVVDHVDFTFALRFTTALRTDTARLLVAAPLVALKYGGPILALLAFHRLLRGPAATDRAIAFTLLFLTLKMLALLIQVLVGSLDTGEKFYELAQTDFLFIGCVIIAVAMWTAALWAADALACAMGITASAAANRARRDEALPAR